MSLAVKLGLTYLLMGTNSLTDVLNPKIIGLVTVQR